MIFTDSEAYHRWADTQPEPIVDPDPWGAPVVRCRRCQGGGYDSSEQVDRRVVLAQAYGDAIHYAQRRTP